MKRLTKAGILIIVIGLSFLAGTLYRSTSEGGGFATGTMFGLPPKAWSIEANNSGPEGPYSSHFLAPREYRMEVQTNTTIDVYILDATGIRLWKAEGKLEPVLSYEEIQQEVLTFHLDNRGDYTILVYNPSTEAAQYQLSVSGGYGVETDLLYTSLIILVLGAVITIASLIPRGISTRKQSSVKKSAAIPAAILTLLILSMSITSCAAQSSSILAPIWMKEGSYVNYDFTPTGISYTNGILDTSKSMNVNFLNGTNVLYQNVTSVIFRWECIQLKQDTAILNVSYSITSNLASDNFYISTLVNVDIANRSVLLQNGTLIGTTDLWLPSSPANGQEVVLWDVPPDRVTANVTTENTSPTFILGNIGGTINGKKVGESEFQGGGIYNYDTGLMVSGPMPFEPMFTALGISMYYWAGSISTNIDMGPTRTIIDWGYVLGLAAIACSIIMVVAVLIIKRLRQRR